MNFKVMRIVMQRFPPTLGLKISSHNWKKKKKITTKKKSRNKSANQARRAVSVAQGSGWTGQESEGVPRARQRKADDGLQVAFGARFASGMQRELAAPAPASTLPRNGSPRRRRESER